MYVSSVCLKCFVCFRRMLLVFHLDVAYIYASVFIRMLQVFHLDVCNGYTRVFKFFLVFTSVSDVYCK
jgi:hypothetical protein